MTKYRQSIAAISSLAIITLSALFQPAFAIEEPSSEQPVIEAPGAEFGPECPPYVASALREAAQKGVEEELSLYEETLDMPKEVNELNCIDKLIDTSFSIFSTIPSLDGIINTYRNQACAMITQAYGKATKGLYNKIRIPGVTLPGLPGYSDVRTGDVTVGTGRNGNIEVFENPGAEDKIFPGSQPIQSEKLANPYQ